MSRFWGINRGCKTNQLQICRGLFGRHKAYFGGCAVIFLHEDIPLHYVVELKAIFL